jgi:hypothetical protein
MTASGFPLLFLFYPFPALFNSCTLRVISMFRVQGKIMQQPAGELRAFPAIKEAFVLAADGQTTFAMEWVPVGGDTAATPGALSERAIDTAQAASCINLNKLLFHVSLH